jgi:hypothetical protein
LHILYTYTWGIGVVIKYKMITGKKMNKIILGRLEKTIISIVIFLVLASMLFVFTSCGSDYQKALNSEQVIVTSGSTAKTTAGADTDTTGQPAASGEETAASTSGNETATAGTTETTTQAANTENQQIIEVTASGGYSPRKIDAKADVPTILIMKSEGAYGCERAFNIPALKISEILPENGQTQFDLGIQAKGTKLLGVCSMGMYSFQIFFN